MKRIELVRVCVEDCAIRYTVHEDRGLGLLKHESVDLFVRFHFNETFSCDLNKAPLSMLALPISLYMIPITYFYDVELVIPEMDRELYERLPRIYSAYSKIYGPFQENWRGKVTVKKIVDNHLAEDSKYDKVVFFSGGVDACHAGISNAGSRSLLVNIPDIERQDKKDFDLHDVKISLTKNFAKMVGSDWLLIANNFKACLFRDNEIKKYLSEVRGLTSPAYKFDGWQGIKYVGNMCCVAPVAYLTGTPLLVMGSSCEEIEGKYAENFDGAHPEITNSFAFAGTSFAEQEGLRIRRTNKVRNILEWCKSRGVKTKIWACYVGGVAQCGFCGKCVRTQLNILCAGENPKEWGFEVFSEKEFAKFIRTYQYKESNPCWLWDMIDTIEEGRTYPCLNELLHWLKSIGYKRYASRANRRAALMGILKRAVSIRSYPYYARRAVFKLIGR